jgi:hypothetical protein
MECSDILLSEIAAFKVRRGAVEKVDVGRMHFSELHHMALVIRDPDVVEGCKIHKYVYELKCKECDGRFLILRVGCGFAIGFDKEMPVTLKRAKIAGNLCTFADFPVSLRRFICREGDKSRMVRSEVSFEDLSTHLPRESENREIMAHDTDFDVMFAEISNGTFDSYEDRAIFNIDTHSPRTGELGAVL